MNAVVTSFKTYQFLSQIYSKIVIILTPYLLIDNICLFSYNQSFGCLDFYRNRIFYNKLKSKRKGEM